VRRLNIPVVLHWSNDSEGIQIADGTTALSVVPPDVELHMNDSSGFVLGSDYAFIRMALQEELTTQEVAVYV